MSQHKALKHSNTRLDIIFIYNLQGKALKSSKGKVYKVKDVHNIVFVWHNSRPYVVNHFYFVYCYFLVTLVWK